MGEIAQVAMTADERDAHRAFLCMTVEEYATYSDGGRRHPGETAMGSYRCLATMMREKIDAEREACAHLIDARADAVIAADGDRTLVSELRRQAVAIRARGSK